MNNTLKITLLNFLLLAPWAMHAMNPLRNLGARAFQTATATAAKFKANANAFKTSVNAKHGYTHFKHSATMMPLMSSYFVYNSYEKLKKSLGIAPGVTKENIEKYPEHKDRFIAYALENIIDAELLAALIQTYPECSKQLIARQHSLRVLKYCPDQRAKLISGQWIEIIDEEFIGEINLIKKSMERNDDILFVYDTELSENLPALANKVWQNDPYGNPNFSESTKILCVDPKILTYLPLEKKKNALLFVIVHELGHMVQNHHEKKFEFRQLSQKDKLAQMKQMEYDADIFAAAILGSIDGGLDFFGAIPVEGGWKIPPHYDDSQSTHPSKHKRCLKLFDFLIYMQNKSNKKATA